tara:strand:+ start:2338 stop:3096 length:759 start_codon:yes stop_codon:yes gene_type:complete
MFNNFKTVGEIKLIPYADRDILVPHPLQGRKVRVGNVSGIKKSLIELGNFIEVNPVKVIHIKDEYLVVDGQHRVQALIELGYDIPIQILPNDIDVSKFMMASNSYNTPWRVEEYAIHHTALGNKIYVDFLDRLEKHEVSAGVLVAIHNKEVSRKQNIMQDYKDGKLKVVDHHHLEFTLLRLDSLKNLGKKPPLEDKTRTKQQFQQAMLQAFDNPNFNFEKFKKGLAKVTHTLNELAKQTDMLVEIYKVEKKG